jgi:hypothetical protein
MFNSMTYHYFRYKNTAALNEVTHNSSIIIVLQNPSYPKIAPVTLKPLSDMTAKVTG